jgi:hypothetical protein
MFLTAHSIQLPLAGVIDVGWRLLDRTSWPRVLHPLLSSLRQADVAEIALAASRVDQGMHPEHRLADLLATVARSAEVAPVLAWNQGHFGEACVAAGAAGYETGIGWREACDTVARMKGHRLPADPDGHPVRGVYIEKLRRSVPRRTAAALTQARAVAPDLPCTDFDCCPDGTRSLMAKAEMHAIRSRAGSLKQLDGTARHWQWAHLLKVADAGLDLARRGNVVADREGLPKLRTDALTALQVCASARRRDRRRATRAA